MKKTSKPIALGFVESTFSIIFANIDLFQGNCPNFLKLFSSISMNTGFACVQNELFGYDNSMMVFGDAKDMLVKLLSDLKELD